VVATGLSFPTALRFAPNGDIIFTEKNTGNVRRISGGVLQPAPMFTVSVENGGERGLLGLALDPDYANNKFIYIFYTKSNGTENEVLRFTDDATPGTNATPIVSGLPAASTHNGGKLEFGSDGKLYVTLGETGDPANSQNNAVPGGKVLRYNSNGSIPGDNPIGGNPLFTKGHRNCFGMAIHQGTGTVFVSENGPGCDDEVNRLIAGENYGWRPSQPCGDADPTYEAPIRRFSSVVAPTGIAVGSGAYAGSLLMGSFNDNRLRKLELPSITNGDVTGTSVIYIDPDAIIDVTMGPDGNPYVATGSRILRLVP
jgi:glucose/arabinose dehydrogenase